MSNFNKQYCKPCQSEDTHQSNICMNCNRSGFAKGNYKTLGECLLKEFDGCEINFKRNSGSQKICKSEHLDNCSDCGTAFNILKEIKGGVKYSELIKGLLKCKKCQKMDARVNRSIAAKNRKYSIITCDLSFLELLKGSTCEVHFTQVTNRQKYCTGIHLVNCQKCNNEIIELDSGKIKKYNESLLYCIKCSYSKRDYEDFCESCEKITKHYTNGDCLNCKRFAQFTVRYCGECQGEKTFNKDMCTSCSSKNNFTVRYCSECSSETTHNKDTCMSCLMNSLVSEKYCDRCNKNRTFLKDNCLSCRNLSFQEELNCEIHGLSLHQMGLCLKCISHKGYKSKLKNYSKNGKGRGLVSNIEKEFTESFKDNGLILSPNYVHGFQVDGVNEELKIVFEYDGWFFHKDFFEKDLGKTNKLLNEDYIVVRIRETDVARDHILEKLDVKNKKLLQYHYNNGKVKDSVVELVIIIMNDLRKLGVEI